MTSVTDTATELIPDSLGLGWMENGQSVLSGPVLHLFDALDRAFLRMAGVWDATEYRFPTLIAARELHRIDYFRSFPHMATFAVCLDPDDDNVGAFVDGPVLDPADGLALTKARPITEVLTPAACYHLYIHLQGSRLDAPRYLTTRNTCFRKEEWFAPLQRQWSFSMREIVAMGTRDEVQQFLDRTRALVDRLFSALDLPFAWETATDPFFRPASNLKHLAQRLNPTKLEAVFDGRLAIASVNLHQDHFGGTYEISRESEDAYSGCVAFGLERWVHAFIHHFGPDPECWPDVEAAAAVAVGPQS